MNDTKQNKSSETLLQEEKTDSKQKIKTVSEDINQINLVDNRVIELEKEISNIQKRERDNILRAKAEVENIRRRSQLDIEKAHKFALENFIIELLPVIDNLERALITLNKSNIDSTTNIEGIELTLKSLLDTVHKFGLNTVQEVNIPFNPEIHQAITMLESKDHKPNQVTTIIQKGYIFHNKLIRPAMVIVSK